MAGLGPPVVTGLLCASPMMDSGGGPLTAIMTVASQASSFEPFPGIIIWSYNDGFLGFGAGALVPDEFRGASIVALFWSSTNDHSTGGSVILYVSGNRSAGFVASASCDGVDLGAIGAPTYNGGLDLTSFQVGSFGVANPFGTSGTRSIVIT